MAKQIYSYVRNSDSAVIGQLTIDDGETLPTAQGGHQWIAHSTERRAAKVRDSDDEVIGLWMGRGPLPANDAGHTIHEVDEATYVTLASLAPPRRRFKRQPNGSYQQVPDSRPFLRFTAPGADPRRLRLEKGDPSQNIQVVDLDTSTGEPTTFTGDRIISVGRHTLRLAFTNGIASWPVSTSRAVTLEVTQSDDFRSELPIRIQVLATDASDLAP